jgi:hypothetical protein
MITLYPIPEYLDSKVGRLPSHARRNKEIAQEQLTPQQIKIEARRLLSGGMSQKIWRILDLLSTGGVLSAKQLNIPERTLGRWCERRLFERVAISPNDVEKSLREFGLPTERPMLYTLGVLGIEIAAARHGVLPPSGYQSYSLMRVFHDVLTNEIVLRLANKLGEQGWTVEWLSKYESTVIDKSQNPILEPDALIRFRKDGYEHAFVIEYHNEDKQSRASEKVKKYEIAFSDCNWQEQWEVEKFPPVLAVFWHAIVGTGYQNSTRGKRLNCMYYGKTLRAVLEGKLDEWIHVDTGRKDNLLS